MMRRLIIVLVVVAATLLAASIVYAEPQIPYTKAYVYYGPSPLRNIDTIGTAQYGSNPPPDYMCAVIVTTGPATINISTYNWEANLFNVDEGIYFLYTSNGTWHLLDVRSHNEVATSTQQVYSPNTNPTDISLIVDGYTRSLHCSSSADVEEKLTYVESATRLYIGVDGTFGVLGEFNETVTGSSGVAMVMYMPDAEPSPSGFFNYSGGYYLIVPGAHAAFYQNGTVRFFDLAGEPEEVKPIPVKPIVYKSGGATVAISHLRDSVMVYVPAGYSAVIDMNPEMGAGSYIMAPRVTLSGISGERRIIVNETMNMNLVHRLSIYTLNGRKLYDGTLASGMPGDLVNVSINYNGDIVVVMHTELGMAYVNNSDGCSPYPDMLAYRLGLAQIPVDGLLSNAFSSPTVNVYTGSITQSTDGDVLILNVTSSGYVNASVYYGSMVTSIIRGYVYFTITSNVGNVNASIYIRDLTDGRQYYASTVNLSPGIHEFNITDLLPCIGDNIIPMVQVEVRIWGNATPGTINITTPTIYAYTIYPTLIISNTPSGVEFTVDVGGLPTGIYKLYAPATIEAVDDYYPGPQNAMGRAQIVQQGEEGGVKVYVLEVYQTPYLNAHFSMGNELENMTVDVIKILFLGDILNITTPSPARVSIASRYGWELFNTSANTPKYRFELPGAYLVEADTARGGFMTFLVIADPLILRIMSPPRIVHFHVNSHEVNTTVIQAMVGVNNFTITLHNRTIFSTTVELSGDDNGTLIPIDFTTLRLRDYKHLLKSIVSVFHANITPIGAGVGFTIQPVQPTIVVVDNDTADTLICVGACANITRPLNTTFVVNVTGPATIYDAYYVNITAVDIYGNRLNATVKFNGTAPGEAVIAGNYTVTAENTTTGFVPKTPTLRIEANHTVSLVVEYKVPLKIKGLKIHADKITGRVEDYYSKPIAGINVKLVKNGETLASTKTGSDGTFTLKHAPEPGAEVVAEGGDDYVTATESIAGVQSYTPGWTWILVLLIIAAIILAIAIRTANKTRHTVHAYTSKYIE